MSLIVTLRKRCISMMYGNRCFFHKSILLFISNLILARLFNAVPTTKQVIMNVMDLRELNAAINQQKKEITSSFNKVETVFSGSTVAFLQSLIHSYWNESDWSCFTEKIMQLLSVYIINKERVGAWIDAPEEWRKPKTPHQID